MCLTPGCTQAVKPDWVRRYCDRCRQNMRRNGDPETKAVSKRELMAYRDQAREILKLDPEKRLMAYMRELWGRYLGLASGIMEEARSGKVVHRPTYLARLEIQRLSEHVSFEDIAETILAINLLEHDRPRRFVTDRGFRFQIVKRLRWLMRDLNVCKSWNPKTGKTSTNLMPISSRVMTVMGNELVDLFSDAVALFLGIKEREQSARASARELAWAVSKQIAADLCRQAIFEEFNRVRDRHVASIHDVQHR